MSGEKILLLDRDPLFLESSAQCLASLGYNVESESEPGRAVQKATQGQYDVVVIDEGMPGFSNGAVFKTIESLNAQSCLILTGEDCDLRIAIDAMKNGAFDFLIKPFSSSVLEDRIQKGLKNREAFLEIFEISQQLQTVNSQLQDQKAMLEVDRNRLEQQAEELNFINEFSSTIGSTLEIGRIIEILFEKLSVGVPIDAASLFVFQKDGVKTYVSLGAEVDEAEASCLAKIFVNRSAEILGEPLPVDAIETVSLSRHPQPASSCGTAGASSLAAKGYSFAVPMRVADELIGVLMVSTIGGPPFSPNQKRLISTIANQVSLALKNSLEHRRIQELAIRDSLTGLYNYRAFQSILEKKYDEHLRYGRPLSVIIIDIDHFKKVNDTHGHQKGDDLLRELASLLVRCCRRSDFIARYGGEEFILILPETVLEPARELADRIRLKISAGTLINSTSNIRVTISLGVASVDSKWVHGPHDLVRAADEALYRAKRQGRNRVCIALPDPAVPGGESPRETEKNQVRASGRGLAHPVAVSRPSRIAELSLSCSRHAGSQEPGK